MTITPVLRVPRPDPKPKPAVVAPSATPTMASSSTPSPVQTTVPPIPTGWAPEPAIPAQDLASPPAPLVQAAGGNQVVEIDAEPDLEKTAPPPLPPYAPAPRTAPPVVIEPPAKAPCSRAAVAPWGEEDAGEDEPWEAHSLSPITNDRMVFKMSEQARLRRAHLAKYVKGIVAACSIVCVAALLRALAPTKPASVPVMAAAAPIIGSSPNDLPQAILVPPPDSQIGVPATPEPNRRPVPLPKILRRARPHSR
jgi:hypothetical protein